MTKIMKGLENMNAYVVVTIYAVVSLTYILISDFLLISIGVESNSTFFLSVLKGCIFVLLTAMLLLLLIRWSDRKLMESHQHIIDLNEEMKRKEIMAQLARLESIGHLAAGMAHNLNNTLTVIAGNLAALEDHFEGSEETRRHLVAMEVAVERAKGLSNTLLTFSEGGDPVKEAMDLRVFIPEAANFTVTGPLVTISNDLAADLRKVQADRGQLRLVLDALVANAVEALPLGGEVRITGGNVDLKEEEMVGLKAGEYVRIEVHDSGPGIPERDLQHIFDPYFSTKGPTRGLGLTLVQSIVRRHDGLVTVRSDEGQGTTFSIYLPSHLELPEQYLEVKRREVHRQKILWMDDEQGIREVGKDLLELIGYEVDVAADGDQALEMYRSALQHEPYSAVILDLIIPNGMGGVETLQHLMEMDPHVRAVVCSGYSNDPVMAHHLEHGFSAVIPKPFKLETLEKVLRDLLDH